MLTSRMKKIIGILLEHEEYVTISSIASTIDVSSRTVLRELDDVKKWIEKNGGTVDKKKGTGIKFVSVSASREEIKEELFETKGAIIYTPEDRRVIIRAKLLQYDEPTKLYALTGLLNVTESTVGSDLDHLETWFNNFNLMVVKKPGLGIMIRGKEKSKRKAIVALIYEHFQMNELIDVISKRDMESYHINSLEQKINSEILDLMDVDGLKDIRELIDYIEKSMGYQFADNGYIALAIRYAVTLKRKHLWGQVELDEHILSSIEKDKVFKCFKEFVEEYSDHPVNKLPHKEQIFLTVHIKGTKLRDTGEYNKISMIEDFKTIQLVKLFIERAEAETGIYLTDNEDLMNGLVKHLRPSLYRLKMDLDIINPLVDEIKTMYPQLFKAIKRAVRVIEDKENIEVPDDEIAYLAIHIGALIHKNNRNTTRKFRAVVACVYGIGASSFLVAQLNKQFPNITITEVISVMDEQIMNIDSDKADILISTVPVKEANLPYVIIDPILKDEDSAKLQSALDKLSPSSLLEKTYIKTDLKNRLIKVNEYNAIIMKLLENYRYINHLNVSNMRELITEVSEELGEDTTEIHLLKNAFSQREEKGSTILRKKNMMLLHCRAEISKELALRVIHLEETIFVRSNDKKIPIDRIIVMVAPVVLNQKVLEVLSEVSRSIIADGFSDIIREGNENLIEGQLQLVLEKYFQSIVGNMDQL